MFLSWLRSEAVCGSSSDTGSHWDRLIRRAWLKSWEVRCVSRWIYLYSGKEHFTEYANIILGHWVFYFFIRKQSSRVNILEVFPFILPVLYGDCIRGHLGPGLARHPSVTFGNNSIILLIVYKPRICWYCKTRWGFQLHKPVYFC